MTILNYSLFLPPKLPQWATKSHPRAEIRAVFKFGDSESACEKADFIEKFYAPLGYSWRKLEIPGIGLVIFAYEPPNRVVLGA